MSSDRTISDEHLNAFVDNQLDADEKSRILGVIKSDEALSRRACETRRLHELVQHAYEQPPQPPREIQPPRQMSGWTQATAAGALLVLGGIIGWVTHSQQHPAHGPSPADLNLQAMYLDDEKAFQTTNIAQAPEVHGTHKILLHISSDDPRKMEEALDDVDRLLSTYRAQHQPVEVELVANAGGLSLVRADSSLFADRLHQLQTKYDELTVFACQTAISRMMQQQHLTHAPALLPDVLITPNALDQILTRLQEGWAYVSV